MKNAELHERERIPKRERTRRHLLEVGVQVLAERGDAFTATDVVVAAGVSNGTFYNHFEDRDEFVAAVARSTLLAFAEIAADETEGADPAWRFAVASSRVLVAATDDLVWAQALIRLGPWSVSPATEIRRHLRADLAEGLATGRFVYGDDAATVDLVTGTLMATIDRIVAGRADRNDVAAVVARLLHALGLDRQEAGELAELARADQGQ